MGDTAVDNWKLEGRLHLWHYPKPVKGLPGWHLNADAIACQSIVDLIDSMLDARWKTKKQIPVSIPERMLVAPGHPWEAVTALLLRYPKGEAEENFWQIEYMEDNVLVLTVGTAKLQKIRQSLLELPQYKDDFALGPIGSECLWFWTTV